MDQVRGHVPPLKENHHTFDQGPNQKYNFLLDTVGFLKHPSAYVPALKQNKEKTDFCANNSCAQAFCANKSFAQGQQATLQEKKAAMLNEMDDEHCELSIILIYHYQEGSIYYNTVNIHRTVWKIREVLLGNPYHVMPIITILVVYDLSSEYFSLIILK